LRSTRRATDRAWTARAGSVPRGRNDCGRLPRPGAPLHRLRHRRRTRCHREGACRLTGQYERTGIRDLAYSNWHRQFCPERVTMIDVDGLEYCRRCRSPLALIETALDVGQAVKPTTALEQLSLAANVPAFCVLYTKNDQPCDFDRRNRCRRVG